MEVRSKTMRVSGKHGDGTRRGRVGTCSSWGWVAAAGALPHETYHGLIRVFRCRGEGMDGGDASGGGRSRNSKTMRANRNEETDRE